jgi:hypothetical protein
LRAESRRQPTRAPPLRDWLILQRTNIRGVRPEEASAICFQLVSCSPVSCSPFSRRQPRAAQAPSSYPSGSGFCQQNFGKSSACSERRAKLLFVRRKPLPGEITCHRDRACSIWRAEVAAEYREWRHGRNAERGSPSPVPSPPRKCGEVAGSSERVCGWPARSSLGEVMSRNRNAHFLCARRCDSQHRGCARSNRADARDASGRQALPPHSSTSTSTAALSYEYDGWSLARLAES